VPLKYEVSRLCMAAGAVVAATAAIASAETNFQILRICALRFTFLT
jgi:hypothetical protein